MKILFLTDNFPPEYNAPATRTFEHCKEWVKNGVEVTVITCAPNFPKGEVFIGYRNRWRQTEIVDGIRVIRVWSYITSNKGTFKRTIDFLSFAVTSFIEGIRVKCDLIVATSPQFLTAVSGCLIAILRRKRWVMEVRDLWPESIKAVQAVRASLVLKLLERVELFLYRSAWKIIVVTDSFKANLVNRGISEKKIFVVKNGVDLSKFEHGPKDVEIVQRLGLEGKFVVGYIGTHGLAHGLDFIVRCVRDLDDCSFHFLFIGEGAEKEYVIKLSQELGLENTTFIDPVAKSEIRRYLSVVDVSLVPLRKSKTFESVIPSKIFESAAMRKPILLGVNGESREIVEHYNAGVYYEPENADQFLVKLRLIRQQLSGKNIFEPGCGKLAEDFSRNILAKKMLDYIRN